ncbi:MAG: fibronectin type III domain-containing protein [Verrucomicrobiota bacterium]|nr:fibronectin type III domain-containing protein [Verrucomicrobiota bacterium]
MKKFLFFLSLAAHCLGQPQALYLSWYSDPTSTITIQWHTDLEEESDDIQFETSDGEWITLTGTHQRFPNEYLWIHTLHIQNLDPNTLYHFRIGPDTYAFQTAPKTLDKPLRFVIGGDMFISPLLFEQMSQVAVKQEPLFAVLGGDLAYAIRNPFRLRSTSSRRWSSFLSAWSNAMITPDRRLIPMLIVAGNHDVDEDSADLFFTLFAFSNRTLYRALDFGSYLTIIFLDTGYLTAIEGPQTIWLDNTLQKRSTVPFIFPAYHEGAYPSFYPYQSKTAKKVRENWCPLFDRYSILAAFEHHSHTFKRTYPLKANQKNPSGTRYFGDGCWGVPARTPNDLWYLEKRASENHLYLIEITPQNSSIKALNIKGLTFDEIALPSR